MSNPLYNMYGQNQGGGNFLSRFQQFKKMFRGDPQRQIQQMLNSGQISQQQYNQAVQQANALKKMFNL